MAGRISISSPDGKDFFNVLTVQGVVLLVWNDALFYMSMEEAGRLLNMLSQAVTGAAPQITIPPT